MSSADILVRFGKGVCFVLWLVIIALPLSVLAVDAVSARPDPDTLRPVLASLLRTLALAGLIAGAAVVLGWLPGKLLGTARRHSGLVLMLLLLPLVLPRYVLYYAWTLLLSPTTSLGRALAGRPELARLIGTVSSTGVLVGWYWPVAALALAQGWRGVDGRVWESARLEATGTEIFRRVTLPLLARPIVLAFGVCFVLSLSEFATFHLAGVETVGTELAVLYELTGATAPVARAAWPVALVAVVAAVALARAAWGWVTATTPAEAPRIGSVTLGCASLAALLVFFWAAPIVLLLVNLTTFQPLRQFLTLHADDLAWSFLVAVVAAALAYLTALFGLLCLPGRAGRRPAGSVVAGSLFLVMFLPASLVAVSLLKILSGSGLPAAAQSWLVVSAGQAARFAGLALIVLLLTRYPDRRRLDEMACLDGATPFQAWRYVHLPRTWPALLGAFLLLIMFSFTELSATMVLLPAGLPNFAQRLLNQMHYARDQQVIATCLVLVVSFVVLAGTAVLLLRVGRVRRPFAVVTLLALLLTGGCGGTRDEPQAQVVGAFGKTGPGPGEFLYPRAIDLRADGTVLVADKTGRIQRLGPDGRCLAVVRMPRIEAGKPTGISVHPDGRLFVADTHYHRVAIFSSDGEPLDEFGRYGQDDGCFIYPTDVAFAPDGRLFVSEYGGNDRISVFSADGQFLTAFGEPGAGPEQFARPSAVCVDASRGRLYVADACNHRIGVYDLEGQLAGYVGSAGRGPGQLRYPYDLALLDDGTLVVCEYGNNRIQLFRPDGQSLALYGQAGRQKGDLAYPWGVAVDARRQAFIVDAGNNRIQVWQL